MLGEVVLAMALGALPGLEREFAHKSAGLRTHMLMYLERKLLRRSVAPPRGPKS